MKASIIIPSYNSCERLYLNLISLNYQDCIPGDFEVIVVDNGSSDATGKMLLDFKANFPLQTLRVDKNVGIAHGRNMGISKASSDLLIFHDSDMIASKDFARKHIEAHSKENLVICGLPWLRIYSYFYSSFAPYQIEDIKRKIGLYSLGSEDWQKDRYTLVTENKITDGSFLNLCFDLNLDFILSLKETCIAFGSDLKGYLLPWRLFITNNVSVDRKKVIEAGMFDENIIKYGFEDYDLGIRLYKAGGQFKLCYDIVSVHQEHPKNVTPDAAKENLNYLCKKYNNIHSIDVILLCLSCVIPLDYQTVNNIAVEVDRMNSIGGYNQILDILLKMMQTAINICFNQDTGLKSITEAELTQNILTMKNQLKDLRENHGMIYLPGIFLGLTKSIFSVDL
jgi:GT2 family glycosyltransferase